MTKWVFVMFATGVFGASAAAAQRTPSADDKAESQPVPASVSPEVAQPQHDCVGGEEDELMVDFVPDAILRKAQGSELEYHVEISSRGAGKARVNYSWVFTNDLGRVLASGKAPRVESVGDGIPLTSVGMRTPPDLADGFYRLTFTVAGLRRGESLVGGRDVWLEVAGGEFFELTSSEWRQKSRAYQPTHTEVTP